MELLIPIAANLVLGLLLLGLFAWQRTSDKARLAGAEQALALFREHYPDASGIATLASDQRGALLALRGDAGIGILERRGRRWNARQLAPGGLVSAAVRGEIVDLVLADFGYPRARFRIADAGERAVWIARFRSLGVPEVNESTHA